jgi:hypothetical protein
LHRWFLNGKLWDAGSFDEDEDGAKGKGIIPGRTSLGQDNRIDGLLKSGKHIFVIPSSVKNLVLLARDKRVKNIVCQTIVLLRSVTSLQRKIF